MPVAVNEKNTTEKFPLFKLKYGLLSYKSYKRTTCLVMRLDLKNRHCLIRIFTTLSAWVSDLHFPLRSWAVNNTRRWPSPTCNVKMDKVIDRYSTCVHIANFEVTRDRSRKRTSSSCTMKWNMYWWKQKF